MIVSITGFLGSGKDTVADRLVSNHGFVRESFAGSLKDAVSAVFNWPRDLLEGRTAEARHWREQRDEWWSERLGREITPRWVLQYWGTEVCRRGFHDDIWIASLEHKLNSTAKNIVITDARFINELSLVKSQSGFTVRVVRGDDPDWFAGAVDFNAGIQTKAAEDFVNRKIHPSESAWVGYQFDQTIMNNLTVDELNNAVDQLAIDLASNRL